MAFDLRSVPHTEYSQSTCSSFRSSSGSNLIVDQSGDVVLATSVTEGSFVVEDQKCYQAACYRRRVIMYVIEPGLLEDQ